jgi:hypothetical protein
MTTHQDDKDAFDLAGNSLDAWLECAERSFISSEVLLEKHIAVSGDGYIPEDPEQVEQVLKYWGILFNSAMLLGFSLEALLKAYWLNKGNTLARDGKYKLDSGAKDNHNLPALAESMAYPLTPQEKEVLSRLSLIVSSYGRYPVTRHHGHNPLQDDGDGSQFRLEWNGEDHELVKTLIIRLKEQTKQ